MTKKEYMSKLRAELEKIDFSEMAEIMEDYENHFQAGIADGKSEERIVEELGDIRELISELSEYATAEMKTGVEKKVVYETENMGGMPDFSADKYCAQVGDEPHKAPKHIVLDLICADVTFRMSEEDNMSMEYTNDTKAWSKGRMIFSGHQEGDTFYAEETNINKGGISVSCGSELIIWVPTGCKSVRINDKSGDIVLQNIVGLESFHGKTMSGDIRVLGGNVSELRCESMSGDVEIRNHASERLEAKSVSGDVSLEGTTYFRGEFESVSGDVNVDELSKNAVARMKSVSGDVNVVVRDASEGEMKTTSGDVHIVIEKECTGFELESKGLNMGAFGIKGPRGGNVRIRSNVDIPFVNGAYCYGDRSTKLYVSTVSGDVTVKHYD